MPCPRDNPLHSDTLNIFKIVTPKNCNFVPVKLWGVGLSHKQTSPCKWEVLYCRKDLITSACSQGMQGDELKHTLLQSAPMNCTIIEHAFYYDQSENERGWIMTWRIFCNHAGVLCSSKEIPLVIKIK